MSSIHVGTVESLLELGNLYRDRCDFTLAIEKYELASDLLREERNHSKYLETLNILLRLYAEKKQIDKIDEIKERLQDLVIKEKIELNTKTYYTLGLCTSYKGQNSTALEYLEKSLALALAGDDKRNVCFAINGIAIVYAAMGRYEDALKEIYNLQVFFEVIDIPELKISSQLVNGNILRKKKKYQQALDIFANCYEELKTLKNLFMYVHCLYGMGMAHKGLGDEDMAIVYLSLAKKTADPNELANFVANIDEELSELKTRDHVQYDLIFDEVQKLVVEKKKGKVDFKNQFILMDLLHLFLQDPGKVFSKEDLVSQVWKQEYDPRVHDNKVYVTIKRLRKLIEPDYEKPKYIFRAKNGYFLNREARILIDR